MRTDIAVAEVDAELRERGIFVVECFLDADEVARVRRRLEQLAADTPGWIRSQNN